MSAAESVTDWVGGFQMRVLISEWSKLTLCKSVSWKTFKGHWTTANDPFFDSPSQSIWCPCTVYRRGGRGWNGTPTRIASHYTVSQFFWKCVRNGVDCESWQSSPLYYYHSTLFSPPPLPPSLSVRYLQRTHWQYEERSLWMRSANLDCEEAQSGEV